MKKMTKEEAFDLASELHSKVLKSTAATPTDDNELQVSAYLGNIGIDETFAIAFIEVMTRQAMLVKKEAAARHEYGDATSTKIAFRYVVLLSLLVGHELGKS